ncbi:MAG TPA: serine hydrolase [Candidatus Elarobacter sp.]
MHYRGVIARAAGGVVLAAFFAAAAGAAEPTLRDRELAAGYKAAFLCSDTFDAGMPVETATEDDLRGIYHEYAPLVDTLTATIDRDAKTVSVQYDPALPPRVAAWRPVLGCSQLPIGAYAKAAAALPRLPAELNPPSLDATTWPLGDANATAPLGGARGAALDALVAKAFDGTTYSGRTSAVIIVRDGKIVAERYAMGVGIHTPQRTWSMAKSLAATVIGHAVLLRKIDVHAPANIPEWRAPGDPRAVITTDQLLRMNSGLWTNGPGNRTDALYLGGSSIAETSAAAPWEVPPGRRFNYANNDILLATYGLTTTLGRDALAFPFADVLWPLGMTHTTPETDWQGRFILSSQVWMTARDTARLGLLYLNDGVANGTRIIPADWPRFVSTTSGAQPANGTHYGAGFWVWGPGEGFPAGTFWMNGSRGQFAVIVPAAKLIVVRRGFDAEGGQFAIQRFARDVLAAL